MAEKTNQCHIIKTLKCLTVFELILTGSKKLIKVSSENCIHGVKNNNGGNNILNRQENRDKGYKETVLKE